MKVIRIKGALRIRGGAGEGLCEGTGYREEGSRSRQSVLEKFTPVVVRATGKGVDGSHGPVVSHGIETGKRTGCRPPAGNQSRSARALRKGEGMGRVRRAL